MSSFVRKLAPVVVLALLVAACGSDRDDDASTATTAADAGTDTTEAAAADDGPRRFGDLESPCGEGEPSGAPDQGVTEEAVRIGYGDDAGFPASPGLNHEMSDAVKAFVSWCNEQGGINGRTIDATYYDAKITEVNNVMLSACESEFFLVGQGFALDSSQEETRRGCGLPSVPAFAVSPQHANAPLKFEPLPVPGDYTVISHGAHLKDLFPDTIQKAGALFANYAATIDSKDKVIPGFESLGYDFICEESYNILGEPDWRPVVQALKNCGAEIVYFSGSPYPNFQNVLEAANSLDYDPVWFADPNAYDERFAAWNTSGFGDRVYFRTAFTPLEEAEHNRATQQYIDIVEAEGGDLSLLGQQAAAAFLLWATAADACEDDLTRDCVIGELEETTRWTAGGFHAPANPGENLPTECGATLKLEGTDFVRVAPAEPDSFDCDPSYAYKVSGPVVERGNIDEDRISQLG